jgi:hypothetical protein
LLGIYKDYAVQDRRDISERRKIEYYAFCALLFTIVNYCLPGTDSQHTITGWVESYFVSSCAVWLMVLLCSAIVFGPLHTSSWDPGWIYYPPLHEKLEKKD